MRSDAALDAAWRLALTATALVLTAASLAAVSGWRPAAWVIVTAAVAGGAVNLVLSVVKYRRTMARPWPRVESLQDDDW